jgi:hypothetical protein
MKRLGLDLLVALLVSAGATRAMAGLSGDEARALARRFRPYVKTTLDGGTGERLHPASWPWFIRHATLVKAYKPTTCAAGKGTNDDWPNGTPILTATDLAVTPWRLIAASGSDFTAPDGQGSPPPDLGYALHLDEEGSRGGQPWDDVVHAGEGIYAHVEDVLSADGAADTGLVNIEYTIVWAYNEAYCSHHHGDLTSFVVVYDRRADLLTRVTYSVHGCALESFRIANPRSIRAERLTGRDDSGNVQSIAAAAVFVSEGNQYQQGDDHTPGEPYVYLAQDPVSLRYEHPVVFAEHGAHELWPNPTGKVTSAPQHDGDGFSFLPDRVQVLGSAESPEPGQEPFLRYNGRFGTDPQSIVMHRTWYWPAGRASNAFRIPAERFTDPDPYLTLGSLIWPPSPEYVDRKPMAHVSREHGQTFALDDARQPFPDVATALAFLPAGGTLSLAAGVYPDAVVLDRPCTLVSPSGAAVLGGH